MRDLLLYGFIVSLFVYLGFIYFRVYRRIEILRSFLYVSMSCILLIFFLITEALLRNEWLIFNQFVLLSALFFLALAVGRATTLESGIYSVLRKKMRWYTLLIGKIPVFLLEHEKIEPTASRLKGIAWGCFLMVFPFIVWPFLNNPSTGILMLGSAGVVTMIYSFVYLK